jgi:hypothetical protein
VNLKEIGNMPNTTPTNLTFLIAFALLGASAVSQILGLELFPKFSGVVFFLLSFGFCIISMRVFKTGPSLSHEDVRDLSESAP